MPKTNGDVFRSMTNAEIAAFMFEHIECDECPLHEAECETNGCEETWIEYLKSEVSEDA